jgi:hypothetical protein
MAEPEGEFSNTSISFFTTDGVTPNVVLSATTNNFTFTGSTGSTNEVIISGVADPILDNDAVNLGYLSNFQIGLYGYDSVGGVAITATPQGIPFNNSVIADTGLSLNTGTGVVTITNAGRYQVSYRVQCESLNNSGPSTSTLSGRVETDPAGGTAWVAKAGSTCSSMYDKNGTTGALGYGCDKTILINAVAGETMRITFFRNTLTTSAQTRPGESSVTVTRMK